MKLNYWLDAIARPERRDGESAEDYTDRLVDRGADIDRLVADRAATDRLFDRKRGAS